MIHSFRLRLVVLSALISGLALIGFGVGAWWVIHEFKIDRLDQDARTNAEREVGRIRDVDDWQRIQPKLASSLGVRDETDLILLVQDQDGRDVFRSPHWPSSLNANTLPWPRQANDRDTKRRGRRWLTEAQKADSEPNEESGPGVPSAAYQDDKRRPPGSPPASASTVQSADGHQWRIGLATTGPARVAVGVNTRLVADDMRGVRNAFLLAMPLALSMIGLGAWFLSSRALRPLNKLVLATTEISAQKLDHRIPLQGEDREFSALIDVFNGMLERLERSFNQAYRFSADAAHELKTPLAILQGQLERAIGKVEAGSVIQSELSGILDEVRRLSTISRKLLLLSQADGGRLNVHRESFDLSAALADLVEDIHMLAAHLNVSKAIDSGLVLQADGSLLLQVLHNLISNAIKYNIENGWIHVSTEARPGWIDVTVANSSRGIPVGAQARIFERFFRAEPSHNRQVDGVGLGLSVSREIARAHGGDITFKQNGDGSVRFVLRLPA